MLCSKLHRIKVWGRDTRQEDVKGSPTQSRISPSTQRVPRSSLFLQYCVPQAAALGQRVAANQVHTPGLQAIFGPDVPTYCLLHDFLNITGKDHAV